MLGKNLPFWKREDGVKPSRTRRCDRERNLQKPLFDFKREGVGSRVIRKPEDLARKYTINSSRTERLWVLENPLPDRDGVFLCPVSNVMKKVSSLHSAEGT